MESCSFSIGERGEETPARARLNYNLRSGSKPQIMIDVDGVPGKRIDPDYQRVEVELKNASLIKHRPTFQDHGFEFCNYSSDSEFLGSQEDFRVEYELEIKAMLKEVCKAVEVIVFDHTIRDDEDIARPPARHVHSDYSSGSAKSRLIDFIGEDKAKYWERAGYAVVNVWRPLRDKVQCSPLVFADPRSVDPSDWVEVDLIYPDRKGGIMGLYYRPSHEWLYLPDMTTEEVVVFTVASSQGRPSVAHSAADIIGESGTFQPRRSIETRSFVRF